MMELPVVALGMTVHLPALPHIGLGHDYAHQSDGAHLSSQTPSHDTADLVMLSWNNRYGQLEWLNVVEGVLP